MIRSRTRSFMKSDALVEAVLFAAARPLTVKQLAEYTQLDEHEVVSGLEKLECRLEESQSGIQLLRHGREVELVTQPDAARAVAKVVNAEISGELTRPSLEALTILAYCGPMSRAELEQIRGVQSTLILRNLMLRGLIEEQPEEKLGQPLYAVTFDFLRHLGLKSVESLPEYEELRGHSVVQDILAENELAQPARPSQSLHV